jgi:hypothetical protein
MAIASTLMIGLGIADVALTWYYFCEVKETCDTLTSALALSWVAIAIWASIPIFADAVGALYVSGYVVNHRGWLCLLTFQVAFIFAPAIVVVTCFELAKKFPDGVPGSGDDKEFRALFGIELVIVILAFVVDLHALLLFHYICFCEHKCPVKKTTKITKKSILKEHQTAITIDTPPACMPESDCRLNAWSAYRWMSAPGPCHGCKPSAPLHCLSPGATGAGNVYGVGMGGNCQAPKQLLAGGCKSNACRI